MRILRTPDEAFSQLPGFGYEPGYAEVPDGEGGQLRMAYIAEGPEDGPVSVLLHGEPSWGFLYREVIEELVESGVRVIVPDLVGFGRSDKPTERADHSYARHVEWVRALLFDQLELSGVTLLGQDWGGLIGLRLAAEHPSRFAGIVAANTGLPTGDRDMPQVWWRFHELMTTAPKLDIGRCVQSGCTSSLPAEVRAAYNAPFPDERYLAGPRVMPTLVPTSPNNPATAANRAAWEFLSTSDIPVLAAFSDSDPITGAWARHILDLPGATERTHPTIEQAGHFLQEDNGRELGRQVAGFIRSNQTS